MSCVVREVRWKKKVWLTDSWFTDWKSGSSIQCLCHCDVGRQMCLTGRVTSFWAKFGSTCISVTDFKLLRVFPDLFVVLAACRDSLLRVHSSCGLWLRLLKLPYSSVCVL